jgi:hypothetical protein
MPTAATAAEKTALRGFTRDGSGRPARHNPNNMQVSAATSAATVPIAAPTNEYRGISEK